MGGGAYKVGGALKKGGGLRAYQDLVLGSRSYWFLVKHEIIMLISSWVPGALGVVLRKMLYPLLLGGCGKGALFGRSVSFRHPGKIILGDGVVIDDGALLDAKGEGNKGLILGDKVYVGRNSIVYTKGGDIELKDAVNVSANCELFSSNRLEIGEGTFIAAFSYILSGGEYDLDSKVPLSLQSGTRTRGATIIGKNVWIAAHAVVADGSTIGDDSVIGAGSVVMGPIPERVLAAGTPAKPIRELGKEE